MQGGRSSSLFVCTGISKSEKSRLVQDFCFFIALQQVEASSYYRDCLGSIQISHAGVANCDRQVISPNPSKFKP